MGKEFEQSINRLLRDSAIRHSHYVERYKSQVANSIVGSFNVDMAPGLLKTVESALRSGPINANARVYSQLARTVEDQMAEGFDAIYKELVSNVEGYAAAESSWQQRSMAQATKGIGIEYRLPDVVALNKAVLRTPMMGQMANAWFDQLSAKTAVEVNRNIQIGLRSGESTEQIVRRLAGTRANRYTDGILEMPRRNVQTLVRTMTNNAGTYAREATFQANQDIVTGVQIVATLDARTSYICMDLDGQVFPVGQGDRPPFHFNCRTVTVPVLASWEELGIDLREAPVGTRAAMDGQAPANETYGPWLRRQPREVQNDALGPARAQLFRDGKVDIHSFVNQNNRPLTLDQLKQAG